jgi:hypothetical protein
VRKIRVGIIGNSHANALKLGWEGAADVTRAFEPTFLLAQAGKLALRTEGSRLVAAEGISPEVAQVSGGLTAIDVAEYDAFLVVGLLLRFRSVVEIYRTHRLAEHAGREHQVISRHALKEAAHGVLADSPARRVVGQLNEIRRAPCVLVPEPLPSVRISTDASTAELWGGEFLPFLHDLYRDCLGRLSAECGTEISTQPDDLVVPPCFSPEACSVGSISLKSSRHREGERFHMNAEFGARVLKVALGRLAERVESA